MTKSRANNYNVEVSNTKPNSANQDLNPSPP